MTENFSDKYLSVINNKNNSELETYAIELENKIRHLSLKNQNSKYLYDTDFFLINIFDNPTLFNDITAKKFVKYLNCICNNLIDKLNFDNMVISGWTVFHTISNKQNYKNFHSSSTNYNFHIDISFYNTNQDIVIQKIKQIINTLNNEVLLFKDDNYIYIISEFPLRKIRIKCHIYKSLTDILINTIIDCNCFLYDGENIYTTVRGYSSYRDKINRLNFNYNTSNLLELLLYKLYGIDIELLKAGLTNSNFWIGRLNLFQITNDGIVDIMKIYLKNNLFDIRTTKNILVNNLLTNRLLMEIPWNDTWDKKSIVKWYYNNISTLDIILIDQNNLFINKCEYISYINYDKCFNKDKIFNKLNHGIFDKFVKHEKINTNIIKKDSYNNTIIDYTVMFNQYEFINHTNVNYNKIYTYCLIFDRVKILEYLLKTHNIDINKQINSCYPIHISIKYKSLEVFKFLIKNNVDTTVKNKEGHSVLQSCIININNDDIYKNMIQLINNCDCTIYDIIDNSWLLDILLYKIYKQIDNNTYTDICKKYKTNDLTYFKKLLFIYNHDIEHIEESISSNFETQIIEIIEQDNYEKFKEINIDDNILLDQLNIFEFLFYKNSHNIIINIILNNYYSDNIIKNLISIFNKPPLYYCMIHQNIILSSFLINNRIFDGLFFDLKTEYNIDDTNILSESVHLGKPKFLLFLLTNINKIITNNPYDICYKNSTNQNLLHLLCLNKNINNDHIECAKILHNLNPKLVNELDDYNRSPLFYAVNNILFTYIIHITDDLYMVDKYGWNIIHYITDMTTVNILMRYASDIIDYKTKYDNYTLLLLASRSNNKELIDGLIDIGSDIYETDIFGNTVLHYIAYNGNYKFTEIEYNSIQNCFGLTPYDCLLIQFKKYLKHQNYIHIIKYVNILNNIEYANSPVYINMDKYLEMLNYMSIVTDIYID